MSLWKQHSWQNKVELEGFKHAVGAGFPEGEELGMGSSQRQTGEVNFSEARCLRNESSLFFLSLYPLPTIYHYTLPFSLYCDLQANSLTFLEARWFVLTLPCKPWMPINSLVSTAAHLWDMAGHRVLLPNSPCCLPSDGVFHVWEDKEKTSLFLQTSCALIWVIWLFLSCSTTLATWNFWDTSRKKKQGNQIHKLRYSPHAPLCKCLLNISGFGLDPNLSGSYILCGK